MTAYAAVLETSGYIVGDSNARSGLHVRDDKGNWHQQGWATTRCFGVATSNDSIYLACGNGVLRSTDAGTTWRVTTGWQITEVLDVAVSPHNPDKVIAATAHGIWKSIDAGDSWQPSNLDDATRYSQSVQWDRSVEARILAASESTVLSSNDGGTTWTSAQMDGPAAVRKIVQDPVNARQWWAVTANEGVLYSENSGQSWKSVREKFESPLYALEVTPQLVIVSGFRTGPIVSRDRGRTWTPYPFPDNTLSGHALMMEAGESNTLLVGTTTDGVFHLDLNSGKWTDAGLPEATVRAVYPAR